MISVAHLFELSFVHALGWTLLHFCWQGAIIAIVLACALALIPLQASRMRYLMACVALTLMAFLPVITFVTRETTPQRVVTTSTREGSSHFLNKGTSQTAERERIQFEHILDESLPVMTGFWFAGVLILLCRLSIGLVTVSRMKSLAVESAPEEIELVLRALRARLCIQRVVKLVKSARVQTPTVIGWLKPAILLPLGCMAGMSALQIEAVLAHELAHIRRHDYLISLFQSLVETLLFYHPAVWWVSGQIRREREHCCDDMAVALCGDPVAYAKALSFLEEHRRSSPVGALGATGGVLKMRIARLLGLKPSPSVSRSPAVILLVFVVGMSALAIWGSRRAQSEGLQQGVTPSQSLPAEPKSHSQSVISAGNGPVQVHTLTIRSNDLPDADRMEIVQTYQGRTLPLQELMQRIRQNVRDRGYAKSTVSILEPSGPPTVRPTRPLDVSVQVSAGTRYTLDRIQIKGNRAVLAEQIVRQFPIRSGDLFNATAIGKGLDSVKKLYASKGYVQAEAIPRLQTDEARHTVTLIIDVHETTRPALSGGPTVSG